MSETGAVSSQRHLNRQSGIAVIRVIVPLVLVAMIALVAWLFMLRSYENPVAEVIEKVRPMVTPEKVVDQPMPAAGRDNDSPLAPEQLMTLRAVSAEGTIKTSLSPDIAVAATGRAAERAEGISAQPPLPGTDTSSVLSTRTEQEDGAHPDRPSLEAIPPLDRSDRAIRRALASLDVTQLLADWLVDEELIRKFVVTIDNMAEGRIPRKHSILRPLGSKFRAVESRERIYLDGYNFGRYTPYINLLASLDTSRVAALYQRYYPLMQQAYAELGYPRRSFHRRVMQAVDHLLDSPVLEGALELKRPSVMFQYADPQLEQLSAVHKQMLRIGPENTRKTLSRLAVLRSALARLEHG